MNGIGPAAEGVGPLPGANVIYPPAIKHGKGKSTKLIAVFPCEAVVYQSIFPASHVGFPNGNHPTCHPEKKVLVGCWSMHSVY